MPGATEITVRDPVAWPVDSKIVIATTDFESPRSSHSEVATVAAVLDGGTRVQLKDIRVCPEYGFSGLPEDLHIISESHSASRILGDCSF